MSENEHTTYVVTIRATQIKRAVADVERAEAELRKLRDIRDTKVREMVDTYGISETARITGLKISNVKYFALKGEH